MKNYIISNEQLNSLVESKKKNLHIKNNILEDINRAKNNLNEGVILNEAIIDTIRKYFKRGLLTTAIITSLLNNNVSAQNLISAGVPEQQIVQAQDDSNDISLDKIENRLLKILNKRGKSGTIKQYNSLDLKEKNNLLNSISKNIDSLNDIEKYSFQITNWLNSNIGSDQFNEIGQHKKITIDTITVNLQKEFNTDFENNSANLLNSETTKADLQKILNSFENINKIYIKASSSTLRNTGEFEGMTWQESSMARATTIKSIISNLSYNLGGCNVNQSNAITENMIVINANGENGDGTSGAKSPYEVSEKSINWYGQQGIPENLWNSNSQEAPYDDIDEYNKNQYVKVIIVGSVVETETNEIVSFKFLKMKEKSDDFKIDKSKKQIKTINPKKVIACPIHV